jgi:hypothetical protein
VCFIFQTGNRHSAVGQQWMTPNPVEDKHHGTSELQQLYKNGNKATEDMNSAAGTTETSNVTSTKT